MTQLESFYRFLFFKPRTSGRGLSLILSPLPPLCVGIPNAIRGRPKPPTSKLFQDAEAELRMAISLTEDEIDLLKQLKAAGERGRTRRTLNSDAALARLVKEGYVVARTAKVDLMLFYRITDRGRHALADAITEGE